LTASMRQLDEPVAPNRGGKADWGVSVAEAVFAEAVARAVHKPVRAADCIGLEVEAFVVDDTGRRLSLEQIADGLVAGGLLAQRDPDPRFYLDGTLLSFEPGGQLEASTPPRPGVSEALDLQRRIWTTLADAVPGRFAWCGVDPWNEVGEVSLQLTAPRYRLMDRYLAEISPYGRMMMRSTASCQVSLDGGGPLFGRRLATAQALVPMLAATFSTSPGRAHHSARASIWRKLDPTRTGLLEQVRDPAEAVWRQALDADIMMVSRPSRWHPGTPGFNLRAWISDGSPDWGPPTEADVEYHLTTLFPEVRPRYGTIEIRSADSVPLRYLPPLVVLIAGAIYDQAASDRILEIMLPFEPTHLLERAACLGLGDPTVADLVGQVWPVALEGAARLAGVRPEDMEATDKFVGRHLRKGRTLSDEFRASLESGRRQSLGWAGDAG
jgi:glutamate--cysteine ligase